MLSISRTRRSLTGRFSFSSCSNFVYLTYIYRPKDMVPSVDDRVPAAKVTGSCDKVARNPTPWNSQFHEHYKVESVYTQPYGGDVQNLC